jgi:hypothetical protein
MSRLDKVILIFVIFGVASLRLLCAHGLRRRPESRSMRLMTLLSRCLPRVALCVFAASSSVSFGANGVLYYNQITSPTTPALVRRINGDGTGDQLVPVNLPAPIYPTISRNGRFLLLTSTDPGRPFKISNNVYIADLFTGALFRTTTYLDEYQIGSLSFVGDLAQMFDDPTVSKYSVHFPYHKALSPDATRTVVLDLWKEASVSGPLSGADVVSSSGRFPKVDVFSRRPPSLPLSAG